MCRFKNTMENERMCVLLYTLHSRFSDCKISKPRYHAINDYMRACAPLTYLLYCIYNYTSSQDKIYILHSVSPTAHSPYLVSKCHLQDMVYMHVAVQMEVLYLAYTMYIMYMYCWAYGCDILTSCTLLSTCSYNRTCRWVHFHLTTMLLPFL